MFILNELEGRDGLDCRTACRSRAGRELRSGWGERSGRHGWRRSGLGPDARRWRRHQRPGRGDWVTARRKRVRTDGARHRRDDWVAAKRQEWLGRGRTESLKQDCRECP